MALCRSTRKTTTFSSISSAAGALPLPPTPQPHAPRPAHKQSARPPGRTSPRAPPRHTYTITTSVLRVFTWPATDMSMKPERSLPYEMTKPPRREGSTSGLSLMFFAPVISWIFLAIKNCCSFSSLTADVTVATWVSVDSQYRFSNSSAIDKMELMRFLSTRRLRKFRVKGWKSASSPSLLRTSLTTLPSMVGFFRKAPTAGLAAMYAVMVSMSAWTDSSAALSPHASLSADA
mmetsp:Transcript_24366/g.39198  ORF Transcript_24366/g.39198 Transcript_24366/m.39198 type:complete len:233 (-) Transcript_24366:274-972(-)